MERRQFYISLVDWIENSIISKLEGDGVRWMFGGALSMLPLVLETCVMNHADSLRMLGLMNGDEIEVGGLASWLDRAFKAQPQLPVKLDSIAAMLLPQMPQFLLDLLKVKITFTKTDADELLLKLGVRE